MPRIKLQKRDQIRFLNNIRKEYKINWSKLAKILNVHYRCLSDWSSGKYTLPENIFQKCVELAKNRVVIPSYGILPDFWNIKEAAKKGGLVVAQKYGGPGTFEGRRKGGLISQQRRQKNPEKYKLLGCNIRKNFKFKKYSEELAELVGIIMGDGGITNSQMTITLSKKVDRAYACFVSKLIKKVLGEMPAWGEYRDRNIIRLTVSGVGLVEALEKIGLQRGNKVIHQISTPDWIKKEKRYQVACVRGLFDTDGGLYIHKHSIKGLKYINLGFCFTNHSKPLINEFGETLSLFNLNFKKVEEKRIYIYELNEIVRFMNIIGSNNKKNLQKLSNFKKMKN